MFVHLYRLLGFVFFLLFVRVTPVLLVTSFSIIQAIHWAFTAVLCNVTVCCKTDWNERLFQDHWLISQLGAMGEADVPIFQLHLNLQKSHLLTVVLLYNIIIFLIYMSFSEGKLLKDRDMAV